MVYFLKNFSPCPSISGETRAQDDLIRERSYSEFIDVKWGAIHLTELVNF